MLQFVPVKSGVHEQEYVCKEKFGLHVAPFAQGFDEHGLNSLLRVFYLTNFIFQRKRPKIFKINLLIEQVDPNQPEEH